MLHLKSRVLAALFVVGFGSASAFAQDGAAGAWDLTIDSPQGANTVTATLAVAGDKVTGTVSSQLGTTEISSGSLAGSDVKFAISIDAGGMTLPLEFAGKLAGETLNGNVKVGDFGEFPFTGKRGAAKAAAAPSAAPPAAASAASAASGAGAAGKWNVLLTLEGMGEFPATMTLTQNGQDITGSFSSQAGETPVKGTMIGNALKIEMTADGPQGPMQITITGDLAPAGFIGKATIAGIGEASWKGTRQ
jgi:hypothetical protein